VNIAAYDDNHPESTLARVLIRNNLFAGLGATVAAGRAFQLLNGPPDVTIEQNTIAHGPTTNSFLMFDGPEAGRGLVVRNNVLSHGIYGMFGVGVGSGSAALAVYSPDGVFEGNVVYGFAPEGLGWIQANYPGGNTYVPGVAGVAAADRRQPGEGPGAHSIAPKANGKDVKGLALGAPVKAAQSVPASSSAPPSASSAQQASGAATIGPMWSAGAPAAVETGACGERFFDDCRAAPDLDRAMVSQGGSDPAASATPVVEQRGVQSPIGVILDPAASDGAVVSEPAGHQDEASAEPALTIGNESLDAQGPDQETSSPSDAAAAQVVSASQ
jgi:hypothetical protein